MTEDRSKQIVVWDTSAINRLAELGTRDELIRQMGFGHTHWIAGYVFDEIASTASKTQRDRLLSVCHELLGDSGGVLIHPSILIVAGVAMFSEIGRLDWEVLLEPRREYELAIISGVFDDELASIQRPQLKRKLEDVEDYFASMKPLYNRLFQSGRERVDTLEELVSMARSMGVFQQNVRYWCESILGREIDWQYAERFGRAFPPIRATIYAFLIGHFHRNNSRTSPGRAGAIDLQAAAYLVLCHKFVTDDRDQQRVLRDVVKYCSFKTDVSWFSGDFSKRFSDCV